MTITPKLLVERFYFVVWNQANEDIAREILAHNFIFRGPLGSEKHGQDGFIEYMRSIHTALANYQCIIEDMITTDSRASAKMTFTGLHQGDFLGVEATGKQITWSGAAFFTFKDSLLSELWILGDIDSVKQQLGVAAKEVVHAG